MPNNRFGTSKLISHIYSNHTMSAISHVGSLMNMVGIAKDFSPNLASGAAGMPGFQGADSVTISPMAQMMQLVNMDLGQSGEQGELDLGGLAQLRQRGDMVAKMIQMKMKDFQSSLATGLQSAGIDPTRTGDMSLKNGDDGLFLLNDAPDKNAIEKFLKNNGNLREQFEEISNMSKLLELLGQVDTGTKAARVPNSISAASEYLRQSQPPRAVEKPGDAAFVINVIDGTASGVME